MTHAELVTRAERWLRNTMHCSVVLTEQPSGSGEIADAIGFKCSHSILVECKTSKSDFVAELRDKKWRREPSFGMGSYRYILCPEDVIHPGNLTHIGVSDDYGRYVSHEGWGLLYADARRVRVIVKPESAFERNLRAENVLLCAALRHVAMKVGAAQLSTMMRWGAA